MPFVRLNSVMVITPRAHYLDRMETWIERLDRAPENGAEKRLYVYPVQNTTASSLAMLLTSIYSGGAQSGGGRSALDNRNTAPGMNQESIGGGNSRGGVGRNGNNNNRRTGSGSRGGNGGCTTVSALQLYPGNGDGNDEAAEVRVVADEENNSLMIYSTGMQLSLIHI